MTSPPFRLRLGVRGDEVLRVSTEHKPVRIPGFSLRFQNSLVSYATQVFNRTRSGTSQSRNRPKSAQGRPPPPHPHVAILGPRDSAAGQDGVGAKGVIANGQDSRLFEDYVAAPRMFKSHR